MTPQRAAPWHPDWSAGVIDTFNGGGARMNDQIAALRCRRCGMFATVAVLPASRSVNGLAGCDTCGVVWTLNPFADDDAHWYASRPFAGVLVRPDEP